MPKKNIASSKSSTAEVAAEAAAEINANRKALRVAFKVASDIFGASPEPQTVFGVKEVLDVFGDEGVATTHVAGAWKKAKKINFGATPADAFAVGDILLNDNAAEEHLAEAQKDAQDMFGDGASCDTVLDVYYENYTNDEGGVIGQPVED